MEKITEAVVETVQTTAQENVGISNNSSDIIAFIILTVITIGLIYAVLEIMNKAATKKQNEQKIEETDSKEEQEEQMENN